MNEINKILFELLLESDGRTTSMLESICDKKVFVNVIQQEGIGNIIHRESCLYTVDPKQYVSHNFMLLYPDQVSSTFYNRILEKQEVIGNILKSERENSDRIITNTGWCLPSEVFDWDGNLKVLKFNDVLNNNSIPFKEYNLYFKSREKPGIRLLEYFNPQLVQNRLLKERKLKSQMENVNEERVVQL